MRQARALCCVAAAIFLASTLAAAAAQNGTVTVPGGTIIDGNGGAPVAGTLTIQGNRIVAVPAPSTEGQAFCINANVEFYLHTGEPCRAGFRLGTHTCRAPNGDQRLLTRAECQNIRGTLELPSPN